MTAGFRRSGDGLVQIDRLDRRWAALLLAACVALMLAGLAALAGPPPPATAGTPGSDAQLYAAEIADVAHGASYYQAAPVELRIAGFPLRPFMAVRPPALTLALAQLPSAAARRAALDILALTVWTAWAWRLRPLCRGEPLRYAVALVLAAAGPGSALAGFAYLFHETWAGLLIALSLALRTPRRWRASVLAGLLAAVVRELALPYLAVMALLAACERRRGEAAAWSGTLCVALGALAWHAHQVAAVTTAADLVSPGWLGLGGLGFVLRATHFNTLTVAAPPAVQALILPAALLGLVGWRDPATGAGRRLAVLVLGYLCGFCVIGQPYNFYWGLMIAPLWPLGLVASDRAARALLERVRRPRGVSAALALER
jgi:hypothetical protein